MVRPIIIAKKNAVIKDIEILADGSIILGKNAVLQNVEIKCQE